MTILEKVTIQNQDTTKIYLFKKGVFYKAYNEGAFLLKENNYKVSVKKIKNIENEVLSIGFPASALKKIRGNNKIAEYTAHLGIITDAIYQDRGYIEWKNNHIIQWKNQMKSDLNTTVIDKNKTIEMIKKYPIANKTPIEVFIWVAELQKSLSSL